MKNYKRTFIASSKLFSGFKTTINITEIDNLNQICDIFRKTLLTTLSDNNFENLISELKKSNFHIHSATIEQILISNPNEIFYVCDHC